MNPSTLMLEQGGLSSTPEGLNTASQTSGHDIAVSIPDDALVIVPVRNMVLFPGMGGPICLRR